MCPTRRASVPPARSVFAVRVLLCASSGLQPSAASPDCGFRCPSPAWSPDCNVQSTSPNCVAGLRAPDCVLRCAPPAGSPVRARGPSRGSALLRCRPLRWVCARRSLSPAGSPGSVFRSASPDYVPRCAAPGRMAGLLLRCATPGPGCPVCVLRSAWPVCLTRSAPPMCLTRRAWPVRMAGLHGPPAWPVYVVRLRAPVYVAGPHPRAVWRTASPAGGRTW